jgi:predicted alpha/beta-hydrolase family hydrolase
VNAIVLTHGAGSNRNAALLVALEREFVALGWAVERVDLAFRSTPGRSGPPRPSDYEKDQAGLKRDLSVLRERTGADRVYFGGHSYGGRQGSMLLSTDPDAADGALLLSYPLHPPGKPQQLRTAHFPALTRTPLLFVSGTKDEFGTEEEMRAALTAIPARRELMAVEGAKHDLRGGKGQLPGQIAAAFAAFVGASGDVGGR